MGPTSVASSMGFPNRTFFASATNASVKASATLSNTYTRSMDVHTCPAFKKPPQDVPLAATSISASSQMITGSFPPNSRETFFKLSAASLAILFPVTTDPVNVMTGTSGCLTSASPAFFPYPVITFITPAGISPPATSIQCRIESDEISDGFMTIVFPAANTGASFQPMRARG